MLSNMFEHFKNTTRYFFVFYYLPSTDALLGESNLEKNINKIIQIPAVLFRAN